MSAEAQSVLPVHTLLLVAAAANGAFVPILPELAARVRADEVGAGALLATANVGVMLASLPVGVLADRLGAHRLTIGAALLVAVSTLVQALARDFWLLLAGRALLGLALGAVWTAGFAFLADATPPGRRVSSLGAGIVWAGLGAMSGPAFAGAMAEHAGLQSSFFVITAVAAGVAAALAARASRVPPFDPLPRPSRLLETVASQRVLVAGIAIMVLLGLNNGTVNLLAPIQLQHNGLSAQTIGIVLSSSAGCFLLFSAIVAGVGERAVKLSGAGLSALLLGGSVSLVVASASTPVVITFVVLRAPFWAMLSTIVYPLAALGARRTGLGRGSVMALLNIAWAVAMIGSPFAAAALAQTAGPSLAYAALLAACVATAVILLGGRRATAAP